MKGGHFPDLLFAAGFSIVAALPACAAGRNELIKNPSPDKTWSQTVGGLFTSGKSVAVVIGISNYIGESAGGYPKLLTAQSDTPKMIDFLIKDAGFDSVYVMTDDYATKSNVDRLMTDIIPGVVGSSDRFLFYWSGHGDQKFSDGRAFGFLPLAGSRRNEFSTMVSMDDIARWDRYLAARHVLFVLDSCLSGLAGSEAKALPDVRLEALSQSAHHLLTAGTDKENVISADRWTGSLFTDSFILGAKGQAHILSGLVSLYSLIDFIQDRVATEKRAVNWSNTLTPRIMNLRAGNGAFFFRPRTKGSPEVALGSTGVKGVPEVVTSGSTGIKGIPDGVAAPEGRDAPSVGVPELGLSLAPGRNGGALGTGVVVMQVDPNGTASDLLQTGDVILDINGKSVSLPNDVYKAVADAQSDGRRTVLMRVKSKMGIRYVGVLFDN